MRRNPFAMDSGCCLAASWIQRDSSPRRSKRLARGRLLAFGLIGMTSGAVNRPLVCCLYPNLSNCLTKAPRRRTSCNNQYKSVKGDSMSPWLASGKSEVFARILCQACPELGFAKRRDACRACPEERLLPRRRVVCQDVCPDVWDTPTHLANIIFWSQCVILSTCNSQLPQKLHIAHSTSLAKILRAGGPRPYQ